jgi:hypothetical protein
MRLTIRATLFALAATFFAPANAQTGTGMAAMQYYVGKWSCLTGSPGHAPHKTVETYAIESNIMREVYFTPAQGSMTKPQTSNLLTAFDAKNERYVVAYLDDGGSWIIADVKLSGNEEQWTYRFTSDGKLGRGTSVRADHNHFTFVSYPTLTATNPDFKEVCERS